MITNHRKGYSMIAKIIEELKSLSRNQLIEKWQELFDLTPPPTVRKEFLIKHLAWEIQTQSQGGYSAQTKKKLEALAKDFEQNKDFEYNYKLADGLRKNSR